MRPLRPALLLRFAAIAGAISASAIVAPALALDALGLAVDALPLATGRLDAGEVAVIPGTQLFEGELLTTGPEGKIDIEFTDGTLMAVGRNSTVTVDRYLLQGEAVEDFTVRVGAGTFRFLTGKSPAPAYSITTPIGTIAVRGTEFDFWYDPETQNMGLMLYEGAVTLCSLDGQCVELDQRCDVGIVEAFGPAGLAADAEARTRAIQRNFPYVTTQEGLPEGFRVDDPSACLTMAAPRTQASPQPR